MPNIDREKSLEERWEEFLARCRQQPMSTHAEVDRLIIELNPPLHVQNAESFILMRVVDGAIGPDVGPQHISTEYGRLTKVASSETVGEEVQDVLDQLPLSVRNGTDTRYEFWQIRYDEPGTIDHLMGNTTLLLMYMRDLATDKTYFVPTDESNNNPSLSRNHYNWQELQRRHQLKVDQKNQSSEALTLPPSSQE